MTTTLECEYSADEISAFLRWNREIDLRDALRAICPSPFESAYVRADTLVILNAFRAPSGCSVRDRIGVTMALFHPQNPPTKTREDERKK